MVALATVSSHRLAIALLKDKPRHLQNIRKLDVKHFSSIPNNETKRTMKKEKKIVFA